MAQETFELLKSEVPEFAGNGEGSDILAGKFDVFVTDGFTGNVCLKTIEGVTKILFGEIKKVMMANLATKLSNLKESTSADTYGGAPILGVKGACLVGHGSSNETAIMNGVLTAARAVRLDVSGIIERTVNQTKQAE